MGDCDLVGLSLGACDGLTVGDLVVVVGLALTLGASVGVGVGWLDGQLDGHAEGHSEGSMLGAEEGVLEFVGGLLGDSDGLSVGDLVSVVGEKVLVGV